MSAPKSTLQNLLDEGFTADGFGAPANFAQTGGYLDAVVQQAGRWVAARVGQPLYDAAPANSYAADQMARAEIRYASSVLWNRRVKFLDANAGAGLQADQYKILQYFQTQAAAALADALACVAEAIRAMGGDATAQIPGSAIASGTIETGRFPSAGAPLGTVDNPFWPNGGCP